MKIHLAAVLLLSLGAGMAVAAPAPEPPQNASGHVVLAPGDLKWMPAPTVLPSGVEMAVLRGDPSAEGYSTVRLKIPPHTVFAPHWHPTTESFSILSGKLFVGMGDSVDKSKATMVPAKGFVSLPPIQHHYVYTEDAPVVLDLSFYGPFQIHYVNPADDPSK